MPLPRILLLAVLAASATAQARSPAPATTAAYVPESEVPVLCYAHTRRAAVRNVLLARDASEAELKAAVQGYTLAAYWLDRAKATLAPGRTLEAVLALPDTQDAALNTVQSEYCAERGVQELARLKPEERKAFAEEGATDASLAYRRGHAR